MYHYVYYSYEEWGRGYIGVRSCKCLPEEDCAYFGSYKDQTFAPTEKIIIDKFESREEALQAEIALHLYYQVHANPHFANKAKQTSKKFDHGKHEEETKRKIGEGNRGLVRSEELKLLWSKQRKGKKKKPFSEEHKRNMSLAKMGKRGHWFTNGLQDTLCWECPEGWWPGRSKIPWKGKKRSTEV
jgi:hypothetical protein